MQFETKIAIVLLHELEAWQKANATAFLVYAADGPGIRRAYERAMARGVEQLAVFTRELFATAHDEANRAAVAAVPADELDLVALALRADRKTVDKVLDKLRPHP
jgi:hypothetical protein